MNNAYVWLGAGIVAIIVVAIILLRNHKACPFCGSVQTDKNPSHMSPGWHCLTCGKSF